MYLENQIGKKPSFSSLTEKGEDDMASKFNERVCVGFDENNPMKQINDSIAHGVHQLDTNIKMNSILNYDRMVDAFANSGLVVQFNNREVGRMVREYT
jgi:ABC-type xylose transport system substrate-binding protein